MGLERERQRGTCSDPLRLALSYPEVADFLLEHWRECGHSSGFLLGTHMDSRGLQGCIAAL